MKYCLELPGVDFPLYLEESKYWIDDESFYVNAKDNKGNKYSVYYDGSSLGDYNFENADLSKPYLVEKEGAVPFEAEEIFKDNERFASSLSAKRDMAVIRKGLKERYQKDIPDEKLLEEAVYAIEDHYNWTNDLEFEMTMNRPLAMAYLALKHEQEKRETIKMEE